MNAPTTGGGWGPPPFMTDAAVPSAAVVARLVEPSILHALGERLGVPGGFPEPGTGHAGPSAGRDLLNVRPPWPAPAGDGPEPPDVRAGRPDLTDADLVALLDLDRPDVDAVLFTHPRLPDGERARLLAGVRRDGRRGDVPAELLSVLWDAELGHCARWLAAGMTSGDPGVALVTVRRLALRTEAGRLRVVASVWGRHGPAAAARIVEASAFPDGTRALVAEALAAPDGLTTLRARLAEEERPDRICRALLAADEDHAGHVTRITAEGGTLPWAELARAHAASPLRPGLHAALATERGCPRELVLDLLGRGLPPPGDGGAPPWLDGLLVRGDLTPADVLAHARPASAVLELLAGDNCHDHRTRWAGAMPLAAVREPFTAALGTDTEAWAVALRLLPDFVGSVPELLTTATATVRTTHPGGPASPG